jgi:glycosyltransferase involved in cell wall biosynthesis
VVVVTPLYPWPPKDGGRIGILFRLRELARHGIRVRLFAVHLPEEDVERCSLQDWCEDVVTVVRPKKGTQLWRRPDLPYSVASRYLPALRHALGSALAADPPDVVHLEQTLMGPYWRDVPQSIPLLLGVHNLEHRAMHAQARSLRADLRALLYWTEGARMALFERSLFARARLDGLVFVSEKERLWVQRQFPRLAARCLDLPPGCDLPAAPGDLGRRPLALAFVGGLWFHNNIDGLLWFLRDVWPLVRGRVPAATMRIAGRGASAEFEATVRAIEGVEYVGAVNDVRTIYASVRAVVLPIRHGTGVKVKTIEALGTGLPCVGTTESFAGIGLEHGRSCLIADRPEDLAAYCIAVLLETVRGQTIGREARALVERELSWTVIGERYVSALERMVGGESLAPSGDAPPGAFGLAAR